MMYLVDEVRDFAAVLPANISAEDVNDSAEFRTLLFVFFVNVNDHTWHVEKKKGNY